jgi:4a-hydroxytetrahydrobiopterin dehydratase
MPRFAVLSGEELAALDLPHWSVTPEGLGRSLEAASFTAAVALVVQAAQAMEEADHHADIDIRWRTVRFFLVSHSAGGVTALDVDMARRIDDLVLEPA